MNEHQSRAWRALGIGPVWIPVAGTTVSDVSADGSTSTVAPADGGRIALDRLDLTGLATRVSECRACALCQTRSRTVFGTGDPHARWMVIGEAPGGDEDRLGEPFVGKAGKLLDAMLAAVGIGRESGAFIANVLKCRPPSNRDPKPDEITRCEPFLRRQIELINPQLILVVGRFAAQTLLRTDAGIGALRGRIHRYSINEHEVPVVVTYHPAYLLRDRHQDKARVWQDLCLARAAIDKPA